MAFRPAHKWLTVAALVAVLLGVYAWRFRSVIPLSDDMVQLDSPLPGARISSPLVVTGRARGTWFFEASFPVILTDWNGTIIAQVPARAKGNWMTTDWVPFEAILTFTKPASGERGSLTLRKDNPSGLPQHDDAREIPILFK